MKKIVFVVLLLLICSSTVLTRTVYGYNDGPSNIGIDVSHQLINSEVVTRKFNTNLQTRQKNLLENLGIGFVVGVTADFEYFKNTGFFKKPIETGSPYTSQYANASYSLHLEVNTPVINLAYDNTFPIFSTFPTAPRYSKFELNFLGLTDAVANPIGVSFVAYAPFLTHSIVSNQEFSRNTWDIKFLAFFDYVVNTEIFLGAEHNPYRIKDSRFYYLGMTSYLKNICAINRQIQISNVRHNLKMDGIVNLPVLPFCDMYTVSYTKEELIQGDWQTVEEKGSGFNLDFGLFFAHDYFIKNQNIMIEPYFQWTLYSARYDRVVKESRFEAFVSLLYVF